MYSILRSQSTYLGYVDKRKSYVIGFKQEKHALHVRDRAQRVPKLHLHRREFLDVTKDIKWGLENMGVEGIDVANVVIDTQAILHVCYNKDEDGQPSPFEVYPIEERDLIAFPFDKNVGVIIPETVIMADENEIVFASQVIEPMNSITQFRSLLE